VVCRKRVEAGYRGIGNKEWGIDSGEWRENKKAA